jgi:hypothetical protein
VGAMSQAPARNYLAHMDTSHRGIARSAKATRSRMFAFEIVELPPDFTSRPSKDAGLVRRMR